MKQLVTILSIVILFTHPVIAQEETFEETDEEILAAEHEESDASEEPLPAPDEEAQDASDDAGVEVEGGEYEVCEEEDVNVDLARQDVTPYWEEYDCLEYEIEEKAAEQARLNDEIVAAIEAAGGTTPEADPLIEQAQAIEQEIKELESAQDALLTDEYFALAAEFDEALDALVACCDAHPESEFCGLK